MLAEQERQRKLEAATVSYLPQPGETYFERDFNLQGEATDPVRVGRRPGRSAKQWFSYDLPLNAAGPLKFLAPSRITIRAPSWETFFTGFPPTQPTLRLSAAES